MEQQSPCATTTDPRCHDWRPRALEPIFCSKKAAYQWEARAPHLESSLRSPQLEQSPHAAMKTQHSQKSINKTINWGFPGGASGKEPACQCRRHKRCGLDPWVRKILWKRAWQPTPVFLPGASHGKRSPADYSPWGCKESDMNEST